MTRAQPDGERGGDDDAASELYQSELEGLTNVVTEATKWIKAIADERGMAAIQYMDEVRRLRSESD